MNTLKFAWKALARFRLYTVINVLGLALSLACSILIIRYIRQELTVDHFCKNPDNTYLVIREFENQEPNLSGNDDPNHDPNFTDPLADPSVEQYTSIIPLYDDNFTLDKHNYNAAILATDSVFLKILPYRLLAGSGLLERPTDAIITRKLSLKLFGNNDPLGRTLEHSTGNTLTITGIVDEAETKSSIKFDLLISNQLQQHWSRMSYNIVTLIPGSDYQILNKKNSKFVDLISYRGVRSRLQLFPLDKFYFDTTIDTSYMQPIFQRGNSSAIFILSLVVVILLTIGTFNFINTYIVVMLKRAKELGIKKVYGAKGKDLFFQIFTENFVLTAIALFIAFSVIEISSTLLVHTFDFTQKVSAWFDITLSLSILILLPLLTSIYPFIKYNYAAPIQSIRSVSIGGHSIVSRIAFLFIQYLMTISLIIISLFFMKQLQFMLDADLGYRTEDIIQCNMLSDRISYDNTSEESRTASRERQTRIIQTIQKRMDACPLFSEWEYGSSPNQLARNYTPLRNVDQEKFEQVIYSNMNNAYMKLLNLQLKEGRLWNDSTDHWNDYQMIINESAQKLFGITDIHSALLQPERRLWWSYDMDTSEKNPPYRIVGVIKDFRIGHLSQATPPLMVVFSGGQSPYDRLMATIVPGKKQEAISFLQQLHNEVLGEGDFEYSFLEDEVKATYHEDKQVCAIYSLFTLIAIIVSNLGLFGLSLFDIQQRYREIALRKVNGAGLKQIYALLLKKYAIILSIAFAVSIPISVFIITRYLEGFAYKAPITWWLFAVAGIITAFISFATLFWQIKKAADINPAKVLKVE